MSQRKPYAIYAITTHGIGIAQRLLAGLPSADLYVSEKLRDKAPAQALSLPLPMGPTLAQTFTAYDCHIFIISVGAVVRMIAPLLKDKKVDPAVLCIDDAARFAICVLSGHVGRGNAFTERVAEVLACQPVITTASDVRGTLTVDILGRDLGWKLDDPDRNVTRGCAAVVNEAAVAFVQETGEPNWWPIGKAAAARRAVLHLAGRHRSEPIRDSADRQRPRPGPQPSGPFRQCRRLPAEESVPRHRLRSQHPGRAGGTRRAQDPGPSKVFA